MDSPPSPREFGRLLGLEEGLDGRRVDLISPDELDDMTAVSSVSPGSASASLPHRLILFNLIQNRFIDEEDDFWVRTRSPRLVSGRYVTSMNCS